MVDLTGYGPISVMLLKLDPLKDSEGTRAGTQNMWSKDYQLLTTLLERNVATITRKSVVVDITESFYESFAGIIAVDPIGDNTVLLYWQTKEQAEQNLDRVKP